MSDLNRSTTPRGFVIYDNFTDTSGSKVRVQESSLATAQCVWIFAERGEEDSSPHLDVEQARRVRDALDVFIRESEAEEE